MVSYALASAFILLILPYRQTISYKRWLRYYPWGLWWSSEVCYNNYNIGCFSNEYPYCNTEGTLPEDPFTTIGTKFHLYTTQNVDTSQELDLFNDDSVTNSNFQGSIKTVIVIHGLQGSSSSPYITDLRSVLLQNENVNLILVDWEMGAQADTDDLSCYFQYNEATANTRVVGAVTGELIKMLVRLSGGSYDNFHIVGHSLGAHTAGYAGDYIKQNEQTTIGRITGLDPAWFNFHDEDEVVRLDSSDATYVDVIHTDGEIGFGMWKAIGHADFYPNGGYKQPGCPDNVNVGISYLTKKLEEFKDDAACSHMRAVFLFTASISCATFQGKPCNSESDYRDGMCNTCGNGCLEMGYKSTLPQSSPQRYYLTTDENTPFCYKNSIRRTVDSFIFVDTNFWSIEQKNTGTKRADQT